MEIRRVMDIKQYLFLGLVIILLFNILFVVVKSMINIGIIKKNKIAILNESRKLNQLIEVYNKNTKNFNMVASKMEKLELELQHVVNEININEINGFYIQKRKEYPISCNDVEIDFLNIKDYVGLNVYKIGNRNKLRKFEKYKINYLRDSALKREEIKKNNEILEKEIQRITDEWDNIESILEKASSAYPEPIRIRIIKILKILFINRPKTKICD